MPNPQKGETLRQFVSRFMGSKEARGDFHERDQRAAVAYSKFRRRKAKARA